jgi:hypothetical protein
MGHPPMKQIQSLFAADLFLCCKVFSAFAYSVTHSEVPAVNKPRRACLYVNPVSQWRNGNYFASELFSAPGALRDE